MALITALALGLLAFSMSMVGQQGPPEGLHFIVQLPVGAKPLSSASLAKRISDGASQYRAYAPIPRVGFFDVAYPSSAAEAKDLNGFAVLLVTALCQDAAEIPLRRVYVVVDQKTTELTLLGSVRSRVPESDETVRDTFGENRTDALYLLPIYAGTKHGILFADFAKNRDAFKLGELQGPPGGQVKSWADPPAQNVQLSSKALGDFIRREYPGFLAE